MRRITIGILTACLVLPVVPAQVRGEEKTGFAGDVPVMEEVAQEAGIRHEYSGPWEYFVGGGVASFDCNGDRMPDLFLAGGAGQASLYVNRSRPGGSLKFEKREFGLPAQDLRQVLGAYPLHLDTDRHLDLVVLRLGENLLLRGGPDCRFEKANRDFAFAGGRNWTTAFAAYFEPDQMAPTLAFGNYVDRSAPGSPWGTCHDNELLRPRKAGTALPDYSDSIALRPGHCALSMLFTDWNRSGQPALRITNDRQYYRGGQEQLWRIPAGGLPRAYTASQGWRRLQIWGMGIAEADLDADGRPEYALSSMGDTKLQKLDPESEDDRPVYRDIAYENGATAHRPYTGDDLRPSTGWHTQFADLNNDGRLDLFIAKGNVEAMPDFAGFDPDNLLLGGADGKFHEKGDAAGIDLARSGRGAVIEDFNADGMLDLLVVNRKAPASLFINRGASTEWGHRPLGNWLRIALDNGKVNRRGLGARITVKTGNLVQTRTIQAGGGHASGQAGFEHFGLGVAERASVRIQWPDGDWSHEYRVFANHFVEIERERPTARYWFAVDEDAD